MSDLHFQPLGDVCGHNPRARLDDAIKVIREHHADADGCLITGDLVNSGTAEGYTILASRLSQIPVPVFPMVGNHDDRRVLRKYLKVPDGMPDFIQYVLDLGDARLICLDSLIPGETAGELCEMRLNWLKAELSRNPDMPRYIFLHHPPCQLGLPAQDLDNLKNPNGFLDVLAAAPGVRQIFAGHVHRPCAALVRGFPVQTIRSLTFQAPPPWPKWDWDSFQPADEPPQIGVILIEGDEMRLQFLDVPAS